MRKIFHLGPMRVVRYLARYHDIEISGAGVSRIFKRNGLNRLPRRTELRKAHTARYQQQVSGHQIPADVYFGGGQTILLERERIERDTIGTRCLQHHGKAAQQKSRCARSFLRSRAPRSQVI